MLTNLTLSFVKIQITGMIAEYACRDVIACTFID